MGKGGGSGGERPDSIITDSSIKLIDALCEGPIGGLVAGAKSIYLNKTPIQNSDGSYNFQAQGSNSYTIGSSSVPGLFSYGTAPGTNTQSYIPGFDGVFSETSVGQEVRFSTGPITRTITTPGLNAVVVTITVPRLVRYNDDGGSDVARVKIKIYLKLGAGLFVLKHDIVQDDKSSNGFEIQRTILIPAGTTSFQLRVERPEPDSTTDKYINAFAWKSYTEIIYKKYNYPNTALAAMEINSKVLPGNVTERRYEIYALEIKIPTNATVQPDGSLTYSGSWNGSFTAPVWCADPAWCLYDLLSNSRYGAAIPSIVLARTKWDYYTASQWCNAQVPNGVGGLEPRFLLNVSIEQEVKAYDLIAQLAGVFGGIFFVLGGGLALATDRPLSPVALLSNENCTFNYQNTALRNRHTLALVSWQNPELVGDNDLEVVEDQEGIALYGVREASITAIGCNRRSQARRFGLWYLLTSRLQADTLVAKSNLSVARIKPGEVVYVADRNKRRYQMGRLKSSTGNTLTLDHPVVLPNTQVWKIHYLLPSGQSASATLQSTTGSVSAVTTVTAMPTPPLAESMWVIHSSTDPDPPQYQVLAALPTEDGDWELTMFRFGQDKWNLIDQMTTLDTITPVNVVPLIPNPPRNLTAWAESTNTVYTGLISDRLAISWDYPVQLPSNAPDPYTTGYEVGYRLISSSNFTLVNTSNRSIEIDNLPAGYYFVQVKAINNQGRKSVEISMPNAVPINIMINAQTQYSSVNSAVFLAATI
jgi:predicted phage tail protein